LITEIVVFMSEHFSAFGLPMMMDAARRSTFVIDLLDAALPNKYGNAPIHWQVVKLLDERGEASDGLRQD